jgi:bifunctional DNA-binding transcriptional regulator/antitoxin component of YhaV-PrlF toxin-antitoxin module
MEKILSFDKQGRLYIPEEMRRILGEKALIVSATKDSLCLKPVEKDPIISLERLGKDKFKGKSISDLKKEARKELEENAIKKIR